MEILVLKLVTGEEIIAKVTSDSSKYSVSLPLRLVALADGSTSFSPFMDAADTEAFMDVSKAHVVFAAPAIDSFATTYTEVANEIAAANAAARGEKPTPKIIV